MLELAPESSFSQFLLIIHLVSISSLLRISYYLLISRLLHPEVWSFIGTGSCVGAREERDGRCKAEAKAAILCPEAVGPQCDWEIRDGGHIIGAQGAEHRRLVHGLLGGHEGAGRTRRIKKTRRKHGILRSNRTLVQELECRGPVIVISERELQTGLGLSDEINFRLRFTIFAPALNVHL